MKFSIISSLVFMASAVLANPMPLNPALHRRQATNATTNPFFLKTSGSSNNKHNGLYVTAYHTGAGFNDAVLESENTNAGQAILNGTNVQFDLGTSYPWGFEMGGDTNYAGE